MYVTGLAKFSPKALATCAWALAVLQQLHTPLFDMVWANLGTKPFTAFSKASLMQLHQVSHCIIGNLLAVCR